MAVHAPPPDTAAEVEFIRTNTLPRHELDILNLGRRTGSLEAVQGEYLRYSQDNGVKLDALLRWVKAIGEKLGIQAAP